MHRKLAAITFLTLDGVMQSPSSPEEDSSNGFTRGGWAAGYWEATMPQVMREAMSASGRPRWAKDLRIFLHKSFKFFLVPNLSP